VPHESHLRHTIPPSTQAGNHTNKCDTQAFINSNSANNRSQTNANNSNNNNNNNNNNSHASSQLSPNRTRPNSMRRSKSLETIDLDKYNPYPINNTLHNNENVVDEDDVLLTQSTDIDNTQASKYSTYIDLLASDPSSPASTIRTPEELTQSPQETINLANLANGAYPEVQITLEDASNMRLTRNQKRLGGSIATGNPVSKSA